MWEHLHPSNSAAGLQRGACVSDNCRTRTVVTIDRTSVVGTLVPACCLKAAFFHSLEARLPGVLVITQRPSSNWRTHKVTTDACYRRASQCLQRRWLYSGHFTCWSTTPEANVLLFFRSIQSSIQSLVSSDRASTTESIRYHLLIRFREIATRKR